MNNRNSNQRQDDVPDEPRQMLRKLVEERAVSHNGLPAEANLARELGLSRPALRELLAEFAADGLLSRRQGATTLINHAAVGLSSRLDHHEEYLAMLSRLGHEATLELLSAELTTVDDHQAAELDLPQGQRILRTLKRWRADDVVGMLAADYIVLPDGVTTIPPDLDRTVFQLVEDLHGEAIEWTISHLQAQLVSEDNSEALETPVGSPVMMLREQGLTRSGRHHWSSLEWHHSDLVDYSLVRVIV